MILVDTLFTMVPTLIEYLRMNVRGSLDGLPLQEDGPKVSQLIPSITDLDPYLMFALVPVFTSVIVSVEETSPEPYARNATVA